MELLADLIMELVPDVVTEFFSEKCLALLKDRVENPVLRKLLYALMVLVLAALGVLLGFGVLCLIGAVFQKNFS